MKTERSCLSKRLTCIQHGYILLRRAAILCLIWLSAMPAQADQTLVCVLVPHFKDEYWLSVANGVETEADLYGLQVRFFEAGGYRALQNQIDQLQQCKLLDPGAILIGAVSSDDPALLAAVAASARDVPVIGLVNELHSGALSARIGVNWEDMGLQLGQYLAGLYPADGVPKQAILLSGPPEAGWVAPLERGLRRGLTGAGLQIAAVYGADTGTGVQLRLLESALAVDAAPDVIIGPAPAIEAAMALFARKSRRPVLAATYVSHSVARGLVGAQVIAAPFDDPMEQGSLAITAAIVAMTGVTLSSLIGPNIRILTPKTDPAAIRLSPTTYFPALE